MTENIIRSNGILSLYNGISAALLMSGTYSTARFTFYEFSKEALLNRERRLRRDESINDLPFYLKVFIAGCGGAVGALVGKKCFFKI
jgi:hypothetical protein